MTNQAKTPPTPADELAWQLESCRTEIANLKALESQLEAKFIELIGQKDEGAKSQKGAYYTATTTARMNRKLDQIQFQALKETGIIPAEALKTLVKVELKLDTRAYKDFHKTNPDVAKLFDRCVTAKPGKTSVSIKKIEVK